MSTAARVVRSTGVIAACTLGSRILGLARESAFGFFFSTSELLSGFRIAFMLPNLARRLFGEGALSAALVPVLTGSLKDRGESESRRFLGSLLTLLVLVLVGLTAAAEGTLWLWRSFHDDAALRLSAILIPYMVFICLVAVLGGVLNVRGRFAVPAAAPALLNIVMLAGLFAGAFAWDLTERTLMTLLCLSVLVGGVVQLAAVVWALQRAAFLPILTTAWRDPQIAQVVRLMGPMAIGLAALQVNSLLDLLIAYLFITVDGERVGPAVLGYAQTLYQLPLGVFGIALATAIFPVLAAKAAADDRAGLATVFARGIRLSLFIALPAMVGLLFVAHPLVAALLERGQFGPDDTRRVAATLMFYSAGLPAYFSQHVLARAFYAIHDSATPARVTGWIVPLNFTLNLALVGPMQERGLALSTAVTATIQVVWLALKLHRRLEGVPWWSVAGGIGRTTLSVVAMSLILAALLCLPVPTVWHTAPAPIRLVVLVVAGAVAYAIAAVVTGDDEIKGILRRFRSTSA